MAGPCWWCWVSAKALPANLGARFQGPSTSATFEIAADLVQSRLRLPSIHCWPDDPATLSDGEILRRLLALNRERATAALQHDR